MNPSACFRRSGIDFIAGVWLILMFPATRLAGQDSRQLVVNNADSLVVRTIGGETIRELAGRVDMTQERVRIRCDRAIQNITRNTVQLSGSVIITQDTLTMRGPEAFYDGNLRRAFCERGVELNDGKVTLTAEAGSYRTADRVAFFQRRVLVRDSATEIASRELTYERDSAKAIATGEVFITLRENNTLITGDSVIHYLKKKITFIPLHPRLWQTDTTIVRRDSLTGRADSTRIDTLTVTGVTMEAYRDSTARYIVRDSVEIVRSRLSARCGEARLFRADSIAILRSNPIVWHEQNQITGDSIAVRLASGKLRSVDVEGNAFAVSRSRPTEKDTVFPPGRFDQAKGKRITMLFRDDDIDSVIIVKTAQRVYYLYDGKALNGVGIESGDRMFIRFENGQARTIKTVGGIEGIYHPEKLVAGRTENFNLPGFHWREDRPVKPAYPAMKK